jgi:hypothetical protein
LTFFLYPSFFASTNHSKILQALATKTEPTDENDSITLRELSTAYPKERQLSKLLDSVAETFSREKSIPPAGGQQHIRRRGNTTGKGAGQVSASGLVLANQQPTVYIAKNEGTNDEDKKLANTLTVWIRAIATTGKRPAIEKDKVWTGLLSYYEQRLDVYAAQIESFAVAEITGAPLRKGRMQLVAPGSCIACLLNTELTGPLRYSSAWYLSHTNYATNRILPFCPQQVERGGIQFAFWDV